MLSNALPTRADIDPPSNKRLLVALAIALALHAALMTIPLNKQLTTPAKNHPISITIIRKQIAKPQTKQEIINEVAPPQIEYPPAAHESPKADQPIPPTSESGATKPAPPQRQATDPSMEIGAKDKSTVFDPRLRNRLTQQRNRVQKFAPRSAEFMTSTGTFIQNGDSCAEVRELVPLDIDSNVTQPFRIKCTKRRRSAEDTDRLARKYGIP
ncbi:hypothetical protein [Microbulbifer magnicolonia]|uniref:hypothetical protein n=1 Tax=Microbulbifer magnicolonia TaxID=3109744 RepID=UPI002B4107C4|nr:hypothetical protein [Microbulbifer sp. GG15]